MSMMVSFVLSFFPRDVLDEILNLIESVSEDFPSYSYTADVYSQFSKLHFTDFSDLIYALSSIENIDVSLYLLPTNLLT